MSTERDTPPRMQPGRTVITREGQDCADEFLAEITSELLPWEAEALARAFTITAELADPDRVVELDNARILAERERDVARAEVAALRARLEAAERERDMATGLLNGSVALGAERTRERDEARAFGEDLARRAREVTCVWCGHQFESTLADQREALLAHANECLQHPIKYMREELDAAIAERDNWRRQCEGES